MVDRCAGLDVHRDNVVATTRVPGQGRRRFELQTQTFKTTLPGLAELAAWLAAAGVTLVGMESTGVYWRTVFQALEDRFECWLLNAHHLRNVPGRKTDVKDSEWICQLVQHGLVRPSFVPPPGIRRLRDLTRLRTAQNSERTRTIRRLEKVLQDAGIKISSVASTSYSKSARAMLEALLSGVTDPEQLAELSKGKMRAKIPQLREALQSRFTIEHHGVMVAQLLAHIDTLDTELQLLSERLEVVLAPHAYIIELLSTIPGVQAHAAQVLIAECGLDMSVFPTVGHFASWAGACPGHHESAGRRKSGRSRPGPKWLTSQPTSALAPRSGPRRPTSPRTSRSCADGAANRSDRRDPPRPLGRLLPHRPRPSALPRSWAELATHALLSRAPRQAPATPTRSARVHRHPRTIRDGRTSRLTRDTTAPVHASAAKRSREPRGIHRTASAQSGHSIGPP
jgi:transposase